MGDRVSGKIRMGDRWVDYKRRKKWAWERFFWRENLKCLREIFLERKFEVFARDFFGEKIWSVWEGFLREKIWSVWEDFFLRENFGCLREFWEIEEKFERKKIPKEREFWRWWKFKARGYHHKFLHRSI